MMSEEIKQLEQLNEQIQNKEKYINQRAEAFTKQAEDSKTVKTEVDAIYNKRMIWYFITRISWFIVAFLIINLLNKDITTASIISLAITLVIMYIDLYFKARSFNPMSYFTNYKNGVKDSIYREHDYDPEYTSLLRDKMTKADEDIARLRKELVELKAKIENDKLRKQTEKKQQEKSEKAEEEAQKIKQAKVIEDEFASIRNDDFILKNVKKLFTNNFNSNEIDAIIKDYFPVVFKDFDSNKKTKDKIRELIQYTKTYSKTGELLSIAKQQKPEDFDANKPYFEEKSSNQKENVFIKWEEREDDDDTMPEYDYYEFVKQYHQLKPQQFFGFRASLNFRNDFYFRRDFDKQIEEAIREKKSLILVGETLSGKTRAIWEVLKQFSNYEVIKPNILKINDDLEKLPNKKNPLVAVFDDIEYFYEENADKTNQLINYLITNKVCVAANVNIEAWKNLQADFTKNYEEKFAVIHIEDSEDLLKDFKNQASKKSNAKYDSAYFNGQIGSMFLNTSRIEGRYTQDIKTKQLIARELLQAVKCFRFFGNYTRKNLYNLIHLKDFCNRRMINDIKVFKRLPEQEWREALQILSINTYNLNFIERLGSNIYVETAFLEEIVQPEMTLRDAIELIYRAFPEQDERKKLGFNLKTSMFNAEIERLEEFDKAFEVYDYMNEVQIDPNNTTFQLLISKAPADKIRLIYNDIKEYEIKPDEVTMNLMLEKSTNIEEASEFLDTMHKSGFSPYEDVILNLNRHISNKKDGLLFLHILQQYEMKISLKVATSLIKKTDNYTEALEVITELMKKQISANIAIAESLLEKVTDLKERDKFITFLKDNKIEASNKIASTLLKNEKDFAPALLLIESLLDSETEIKPETLNLLIPKIDELQQGISFIELIAKKGFALDREFFKQTSKLIKKAAHGIEILKSLETNKLQADGHFIRAIINKTISFQEALSLMNYLNENNFKTDQQTIFGLGQKVKNFKDALAFLQLLNQKQLKPDLRTITSLIPKTESYKQAKAIYTEIGILELTPDTFVFNTLMMRTDNINEVLWIMNEMLTHDVTPDVHTKKRLLKKAEIVERRAPEQAQKMRDIANRIKG